MKDFSFKFDADFNFLLTFFLRNFLHNFFLCCPLPYSLPSGSSANLTARRFAPSWHKMLNKIDTQNVLDNYEPVRGLFLTTFGVVSELFLTLESQLLSAISALDFVSIGLCDFGPTQIPILSFDVPWSPTKSPASPPQQKFIGVRFQTISRNR